MAGCQARAVRRGSRGKRAQYARGGGDMAERIDLLFRFGAAFIVIAFVSAIGLVWASYFYSDRLAIAAARAREADPHEFRQFHDLVEELCIGVGLPKPS